LGLPVHQDDQAYAPDGWSYGDDRRGVPFARLRTVDGQHLFTLKRSAENVLSCEEHETAIADRDQMHHAIMAMGFRPPCGYSRCGVLRRLMTWSCA
jgi:adenylate cyclase class 2